MHRPAKYEIILDEIVWPKFKVLMLGHSVTFSNRGISKVIG